MCTPSHLSGAGSQDVTMATPMHIILFTHLVSSHLVNFHEENFTPCPAVHKLASRNWIHIHPDTFGSFILFLPLPQNIFSVPSAAGPGAEVSITEYLSNKWGHTLHNEVQNLHSLSKYSQAGGGIWRLFFPLFLLLWVHRSSMRGLTTLFLDW